MRDLYFDIIYNRLRNPIAGAVRGGLFLLSKVYGLGVARKRSRLQAQARKLPLPVISVGNLTWGGTGKTPLVRLILEHFCQMNKVPAVLMRGFGEDENALLRATHPNVIVGSGPDRFAEAEKVLSESKPDLFVLDDGFQQWGIDRDLNILTVNAEDPWGPGFLIPRGSLREDFDCLKRADIAVVNHAQRISEKARNDLKVFLEKYVDAESVFFADHAPDCLIAASEMREQSLTDLKGKRVLSFCGIANPDSFRKTLTGLGAEVEMISFGDHHSFSTEELIDIKHQSENGKFDLVVTTEKDYMRMPESLKEIPGLHYLKIKLEIAGGYERFFNRLDRVLAP